MFYQPPSSRILTDTANVDGSERIYNQEQIAAALTGWGLSCRAVMRKTKALCFFCDAEKKELLNLFEAGDNL